MNEKKLQDILNDHKKWIDGTGGRRADLQDANLWRADLRNADLRNANLRNANLQDADLQGADLRDANLWRADLRDADLWNANLRNADLRNADLRNANLWNANLPNFQIPPEEGSFFAWKKCRSALVKLEIPSDAERTSSLVGRKCRASKAKVIEIYNGDGDPCDATEAIGIYDRNFIYRKGEIIEPDRYDDDIRIECSNGIHFFITKQEAIEWQ